MLRQCSGPRSRTVGSELVDPQRNAETMLHDKDSPYRKSLSLSRTAPIILITKQNSSYVTISQFKLLGGPYRQTDRSLASDFPHHFSFFVSEVYKAPLLHASRLHSFATKSPCNISLSRRCPVSDSGTFGSWDR